MQQLIDNMMQSSKIIIHHNFLISYYFRIQYAVFKHPPTLKEGGELGGAHKLPDPNGSL